MMYLDWICLPFEIDPTFTVSCDEKTILRPLLCLTSGRNGRRLEVNLVWAAGSL